MVKAAGLSPVYAHMIESAHFVTDLSSALRKETRVRTSFLSKTLRVSIFGLFKTLNAKVTGETAFSHDVDCWPS